MSNKLLVKRGTHAHAREHDEDGSRGGVVVSVLDRILPDVPAELQLNEQIIARHL